MLAVYSDMKGRVVLDDIPDDLEGVGAIPLEPMGSRKPLDYVVSAMLERGQRSREVP